MNSSWQTLGYGIGFRSCHYDEILENRPASIDWLEVISENFMNVGGRPRSILEEARRHYPIALHGVSLSIGSPDPLSPIYLKQLKDLCAWARPSLISDHLCFTTHNSHNSHDLLPIPYTRKNLRLIADKLKHLQDALGVRFMLENPSAYVAFEGHEMPEDIFLAELVEASGCGVLLDVNNLTVNQHNLNLNPLTYLRTLPPGSVGQIHLAGHSIQSTDAGTVRIDTHDHPVLPETWDLFAFARAKWPNASPMIEWDDHIPPLRELISTLEFARSVEPRQLPELAFAANPMHPANASDSLDGFFGMVVSPEGVSEDDPRLSCLSAAAPVPRLLGTRVYNNAYFSRLREVLKSEFPALAAVTTEDGFDAVASEYLRCHPSSESDIGKIGTHLPGFLRNHTFESFDFGVPLGVLAELSELDLARSIAFTHTDQGVAISKNCLLELAADDWERVLFTLSPTLAMLRFDWSICDLWNEIHSDAAPSKPPRREERVIVWRQGYHVTHQTVTPVEFEALTLIRSGKSFRQTITELAQTHSQDEESMAGQLAASLVIWFDKGMIHSQALK